MAGVAGSAVLIRSLAGLCVVSESPGSQERGSLHAQTMS